MASVLYFNAKLLLSGTKYPVYGFLIEDQIVEVYQGWLEKDSNEDKLVGYVCLTP